MKQEILIHVSIGLVRFTEGERFTIAEKVPAERESAATRS